MEHSGNEPRSWVNRTIIGVSVTSALGDFAYETANAILPGFLAVLGVPAAVLGAIEGIADALSSFTKLGAGYLSDRLGQRKPIVVIGYAMTAVAQVLFALASGWGLILLGRSIAWLGRGIRGPLRDAILAEAITSETRGRAFGLHRAADTLGAVVGPLLGVLILSWIQGLSLPDLSEPFRIVFLLTLIPGTLSVLSFSLLVVEKKRQANHQLRFVATVRSLPASFRGYLRAVGIFGLGDFAHTLLILAAAQSLAPVLGTAVAAQTAAFLYVWRNTVQTFASYPIGSFADRFGHRNVLIGGYALGVITALLASLAFALNTPTVLYWVLIFTLAGLYFGVEDALEASMTADYVTPEVRGTAYGVLGTVNGIGDFVSSSLVGFLWTAFSPVIGFGVAAFVMALGTLFMTRVANLSEKNE